MVFARSAGAPSIFWVSTELAPLAARKAPVALGAKVAERRGSDYVWTLLGAQLWYTFARRVEVTAQEARAALRRRGKRDGEQVCVVARGVVFPAKRNAGTLFTALSNSGRSTVLRLL